MIDADMPPGQMEMRSGGEVVRVINIGLDLDDYRSREPNHEDKNRILDELEGMRNINVALNERLIIDEAERHKIGNYAAGHKAGVREEREATGGTTGIAMVGLDHNGEAEFKIDVDGHTGSVYLSREFWDVCTARWNELDGKHKCPNCKNDGLVIVYDTKWCPLCNKTFKNDEAIRS